MAIILPKRQFDLLPDVILKPYGDSVELFSLMTFLELDILAECIDVLLECWLWNC
jgi:hypothetical protein